MRLRDFSADNPALQPGDEVHCPHCRGWHLITASHTEGTEYTRLMLFWDCRGGRYYAGQIGAPSRQRDARTPKTSHSFRVASRIQ